jgi:DNA-binding LacI/PurR family transcriptional regulator
MRKKPAKKSSIYTIADELGLSPGTVSRALRNRPEIGAATRRAVRQRATEIGFKLRSFTARVTNICVVIETEPGQRGLFSAYVDSVLDGVWNYCIDNDVELSLYGAQAAELTRCDLIRVLGRRGVNAAVFLNASRSSSYFAKLNDQNFPYCCVMTAPDEARQWIIQPDSVALSRKATEYLIELGHRRIAVLDSLETRDIGKQRRRGYVEALQAAGLPADPSLIFSHSNCDASPVDDFDFAAHGVRTLLQLPERPTAFLTMSDEAGLAALHELGVCGLNVPRDASVMSFDDSRLCAFSSPPLSVVCVPYERMGYDAAALARRRLDENLPSGARLLPTVSGSLIIRGSTGRPAAAS